MINNLNVKESVSKSYSKINIQKQTLDFFGQGFYNGRKYIFMESLSKIKHQIKSGKYYIFWGACTIAVMAGQIYVGVGYRSMSQEVKDLTEVITIKMEWEELRRGQNRSPYMPMVDNY